MKSIKNLLALSAIVLLTFLTGCATATNNFGDKVTGEKAYDQMVKKFNIQGLDLSDPDFKSLKENTVCHFDDTASYYSRPNHPVVSVCYSENDKVNFVFFTRINDRLLKDVLDSGGYVSTSKDNSYLGGSLYTSCPNIKRDQYGSIRLCQKEITSSKKVIYKFQSYSPYGEVYLINFGEKTLKEENDTTSLLSKIREVLIKVK